MQLYWPALRSLNLVNHKALYNKTWALSKPDQNLGLYHYSYTDQLLESWTWDIIKHYTTKLEQCSNQIRIMDLIIATYWPALRSLDLGNDKAFFNKNWTVMQSGSNLGLENCNFTDHLLEAWTWEITKNYTTKLEPIANLITILYFIIATILTSA